MGSSGSKEARLDVCGGAELEKNLHRCRVALRNPELRRDAVFRRGFVFLRLRDALKER